MPIYDFLCSRCESLFESLVRATDVPVCPECGSSEVKKVLAPPAAPGRSREIISARLLAGA